MWAVQQNRQDSLLCALFSFCIDLDYIFILYVSDLMPQLSHSRVAFHIKEFPSDLSLQLSRRSWLMKLELIYSFHPLFNGLFCASKLWVPFPFRPPPSWVHPALSSLFFVLLPDNFLLYFFDIIACYQSPFPFVSSPFLRPQVLEFELWRDHPQEVP